MEGGYKNVVLGGEKELKMEESKNDDSKENKPLNKVPVDISKTKEKDFEENDDLHLQLSSDSDEELKDIIEDQKMFSCPNCLKLYKDKLNRFHKPKTNIAHSLIMYFNFHRRDSSV